MYGEVNYLNSFKNTKIAEKKKKKLVPGAFFEKQFCDNCLAFNFFAI